jgi:argininosuccinate lyase
MKLWGGRFAKKTHKAVEDFTRSIHFDQALAKYDLLGSLYHVAVLKRAKLLTPFEYKKLQKGLHSILSDLKSGNLKINNSFEDIHSYIQYLLKQKVGKPADKLQTCRSRNDQVVFATKLYCLDHIKALTEKIHALQKNLRSLANQHKDILMPGYTHLQHAMPIALSDYFHAYLNMITRDTERLGDAAKRISLTMGSGALAGTMIDSKNYSFPAKGDLLKTLTASKNALDTVSDRDFIIEILSALAILSMHLSRMSEDLILWASKEFDFIEIDDAFCTGSSLMPQKKNPDVLEMIRGSAGRMSANLLEILVVMKGLPLSYNRDMQLDKEPLFDAFRLMGSIFDVLSPLLQNLKFKKEKILSQISDETLYATDLAEFLVKNGVSFHDAHQIIGKLIRMSGEKKISLLKFSDSVLGKFHPLLNDKVVQTILNAKRSVLSKKSIKR